MQPWNQWGVQATSGYTLPGYPAAMPSPVVTAAPTVSTMPYAMGGYQWPSYSATNVTPTVGAGWPVQNQQQQWDQWTQWQQQYAQWQQEYGDKYMQSVQQSTQASVTVPTPALPTCVPPTTVTAAVGEKRAPEASTAPGAKKARTDENSVEAIKDVLKEMAESEKQFDEQFNNWESQFNSWREQNASHPDTEQYKAYEAKWKSWRNQLLQRREQMRKKREAKMTELSKLEQQAGGASMAMPPPTLGATSVASASVTPAMTPAVLPSTALPPPGMAPDSSSPYAMYNPSSFYNQQGGYMFGSSAPYGVASVFPPVPPPAVVTSTGAPPLSGAPPSQTTVGLPPGLPSPGQSKALDSASSANNVSATSGKTQHTDSQPTVNFNQPPPSTTTTPASSVSNVSQASADGGGIPGLDLLNQPSSTQTSKPPDFNPASTSSLIPKQQEIIQTPADSKPFDFPSPAKNQNTSIPPPMMNFPPPGYLNPSFKVFQMGTNPNPGLLPAKHNPNKDLVEALMSTIDTNNPGPSQEGSRMGNQTFNKDRNQMSEMDPKGNNFGSMPPGPGQNQDFRGNPINNFPTNNFSDGSNQWNPPNKTPLLPTPNMQGQGFAGGKQGDIQMGGNNTMPPFNQPYKNDGSGSRFGGPQLGFRGNDGSQGFRGNEGPPPGFRGSDGGSQGFKTDGLPPGYRTDGPPPNFRNDGPPPNFRNDGPPPNFRSDGLPPNYRNDGPPPNYRNDGPPPNYRGQDGFRQNGPPPGFRGNDVPQGQGFRDGPPPGFRGDNFRPNDGPGNFRGNKFRNDDFDRPSSRHSYGEGDYNQGNDHDEYNRDFNEQQSDQGRTEYNEEGYDNPPDDRGPPGNQRDFRFPPSDVDSLDRNSFKEKNAGGEHGMAPFNRGGPGFAGPGGRPKSGPQPLMSSGLLGPGPPSLMGAPPLLQRQQQQPQPHQQLPPLYSPDKIIDYCHKLSNLGVPSFYEPVTMIDYAHGSHKLPEGEEDRFPPSENRDLFPKDDDFDGRTLSSAGRGSPGFRSRSDGRRTSSWGRTRESRWEREGHAPSPRREEGRSRDREDRPRDRPDDRRDRDGRDDRERREDRERDTRRDLRRDERRGEDRRGEDRRGDDRRGEERRGDDRRGEDRREDRRGEDRRGEDRRGDDRREREERDSPRREERWRHEKSGRHDDDRHKDDRRDRDRSSDKAKDPKRNSQPKTRSPSPPNKAPREEGPMKISPEKTTIPEVIGHNPVLLVDDLLLAPGRERRPPRVVVILRGPPGSGKTFVAKLMKDKEVEMGGSAPRILSLDDYFMVETEKEDIDPETGRTTKVKAMEYEYESGMEPHYRESLVKAFRKTIIDGYFPFIIVDCINDKLSHFEEISSFAKQKSFQVYICEMDLDVGQCVRRNVHKRHEQEINNIVKNWEKTPVTETILDVRSLLQSASITEVNMEDTDTVEEMQLDSPKEDKEENKENDVESKLDENDVSKTEETGTPGESKDDKKSKSGENEEATNNKGLLASALASKWDDSDSSNNKLDRLDGLSKARRATSIKDWLQLPEDYFETSQPTAIPGKKRVRWADLEERREQEKMRAIGFVVGQTDWSRMLDPSSGQSKLTQTKYI